VTSQLTRANYHYKWLHVTFMHMYNQYRVNPFVSRTKFILLSMHLLNYGSIGLQKLAFLHTILAACIRFLALGLPTFFKKSSFHSFSSIPSLIMSNSFSNSYSSYMFSNCKLNQKNESTQAYSDFLSLSLSPVFFSPIARYSADFCLCQ